MSNRNATFTFLLFGGFIIWNSYYLGYSLCLINNILHIPCPGCGLTRAFICIVSADIKGAFYYNALSLPLFAAFIFSGVWMTYDFIKKDDSFNRTMHQGIGGKYIFIIAAITLANWIWNIKKGI